MRTLLFDTEALWSTSGTSGVSSEDVRGHRRRFAERCRSLPRSEIEIYVGNSSAATLTASFAVT